MHDALTRYFALEKLGGIAAIVLGIIALAAVALIFRTSYRGAMLPLGLVALIQVAVGTGLYLRTDKQVDDLRQTLDRSATEFKQVEGARMQKVMRSFVFIEIGEIVILAAGIALSLIYKQREFVFAAGLGLIWQSSVMLIFDFCAEERGRHYFAAIEKLTG